MTEKDQKAKQLQSADASSEPKTDAAEDGKEIWSAMRRYTPARIGIGRTGVSMRTDEILDVGWSHAMARDAIHRPLDYEALANRLKTDGWEVLTLSSRVKDRATYLMRPDLGRRLDEDSAELLREATNEAGEFDVVFVVADGLSTLAVEGYAADLLKAMKAILPSHLRVAPVIVAQQGRVALGDEIAALLGARLVVMLIGERPGLSSRDSLGVYITYAPKVGMMDSQRNCISNIRDEGLKVQPGAEKMLWFIKKALQDQVSGIDLKDESGSAEALSEGLVLDAD